jgi:hypothetical protein
VVLSLSLSLSLSFAICITEGKFIFISIIYYFFFFFLAVLRFELRAYTISYSASPFFVMVSFELRSLKLFAQPGFELQSS